MKRPSESEFGKALREVDLRAYVYRLPDPKTGFGVSNWKPCDFMVWFQHTGWSGLSANRIVKPERTQEALHWLAEHGPESSLPDDFITLGRPGNQSAWFECKDTDQVNSFPFADMRPSQLAGIADAQRVGVPYFLAIYWRKAKRWTISDAVRVMGWRQDEAETRGYIPSISRELLMSRFGFDAAPRDLSQTLKAAMLGELNAW